MTVPVGGAERERPCKESNVVTVKRVKGQLLQREESYTEALPFEDDNPDADDNDGDVVLKQYNLKTQLSHASSQKPKAQPALQANNAPSPNVVGSPALRRNVRAWCDATGLPTTIIIRCKDRVFYLHKFPLVSRSGYLKRALKDAAEITLLNDVPGGPETFELVSNFCYGSTILMEPANIAELCCVADYLQMTEDYGRANLSERTELYLTQVALQSWDDTVVVLEHCERLAPYAEQLGIVRRCVDALAFMVCMELLDPVARKNETWWVQDLVALSPSFFVKLVLALRREGMQENYVGQVITAFADRWIFGLGGERGDVPQKLDHADKGWVSTTEPAVLIEAVVGLLPLERGIVPTGFLFALLRRGLTCALNDDCRIQIETRIVLQLENATLHDVLLPGKKEKESRCVLKNELESMERILKLFLTRFRVFDDSRAGDMAILSVVAKLWDEYLAEIAFDLNITPARFAELIERIPANMRVMHDEVYSAIHTYLKAHPSTTQEERLILCRTLNCQKLSQEACAHAVQNDLMPLRMIVQAMFMQQLQTRSVLNSHLESAAQSFREHPDSHSHGRSILPNSAPLSSYPSAGNSGRHHTCDYNQDSFRSMGSSFRDMENDLYIDDGMCAAAPHNTAVKEELPPPRKSDYQATESRLRNLEAELSRMRKTLSQSLMDSSQTRHEPRRQAASASTSTSAPETMNPKGWTNHAISMASHSGRSGQLSTPYKMATVHEGAVATGNSCGGGSGCMSQLKPVNGTTGLLSKTLQKLKIRSFGKATKSTAVAAKAHTPRLSAARFESDMSHLVARTDSMPRPATQQVKPRHARRNSMS